MNPTSDFMEKFASSLADAMVKIAEKYEGSPGTGDPESLVRRLYEEALNQLLRTESKALS